MSGNDNLDEDELVARKRGKWSVPGVPHKGWECVEIEDLGAPDMICEMCETRDIRYVHHMEHPTFSEALRVGCICAGHMEGDLAASRAREATMKNRTTRRKRWTTRRWKVSRKGNPYIFSDGYQVTVYTRGGGWACTVAPVVEHEQAMHSRRNYPTQDAAKLAGFDQITKLVTES